MSSACPRGRASRYSGGDEAVCRGCGVARRRGRPGGARPVARRRHVRGARRRPLHLRRRSVRGAARGLAVGHLDRPRRRRHAAVRLRVVVRRARIVVDGGRIVAGVERLAVGPAATRARAGASHGRARRARTAARRRPDDRARASRADLERGGQHADRIARDGDVAGDRPRGAGRAARRGAVARDGLGGTDGRAPRRQPARRLDRADRRGVAAVNRAGVLVLLAACGKLQGFSGEVPPLATFEVTATGSPPANADLKVALVWGKQWLVEPLCIVPLDSRDDPNAVMAVIDAGCRDPFGFVPAVVGANEPLTVGVPAAIALQTLPGTDVMVGALTARVAYGSFVVD